MMSQWPIVWTTSERDWFCKQMLTIFSAGLPSGSFLFSHPSALRSPLHEPLLLPSLLTVACFCGPYASLSFKQHISAICHKTLAGVSVIFRCFVSKDTDALLCAYIAVVRLMLEYTCTVWNPLLLHRCPGLSEFR